MNINFEYAKNKNISFEDIIALQLIFQNSSGKMEEFILEVDRSVLNGLFAKKYLTLTKAKNKKQTPQNRVRLSKTGKEIYRNLTAYLVIEEDNLIYNFMSDVYNKLDKKQASKNKIISLIAFFRLESGLNTKQLYELCKRFVNDSDNMAYNNKLEYVFFKPENMYSKPKLSESRLWDYYENLKRQQND